jgi:drug/metabolite transporter (DMT)-like permease
VGLAFASEFVFLYIALDHTTVTRSSVMLYSMPVWLAVMAHFLLPGERMRPLRAAGLALAFLGMAGALLDRGSVPAGAEAATVLGDALSIAAAIGWAAVALLARKAGQAGITPEMQLLWMLVVSAPLLFVASLGFGPFLRDPGALELGAFVFQVVVVVSGGFLLWFWLLGIYPAAGVASFSFLSPIFGIALGWALLDEPIGPGLIVAGAMVAGGLVLINWPPRAPPAAPQVPQKVRNTR